MMKKFKDTILFIILSLSILIFITNPQIIMNSVLNSINILFNTLIPSLLPFFILADILINYDYLNFLNKIFKFKYFNIIFLTMLSGLPSNAKYVKELLDNNEIIKNDAEKLLSFTFFPNPMFVIGTIGYTLLNNAKLGIKILIIIYLSNLLFYLFSYKNLSNIKNTNIEKSIDLFTLLKKSIIKNAKTLLIIFGTIVFFNIITNILIFYLPINKTIIYILNLYIEITSGITNIVSLNLSKDLLIVLITASLSFSGISVLFQVFSILNDYNLDFLKIIKNKLIISLISLVLSLFI